MYAVPQIFPPHVHNGIDQNLMIYIFSTWKEGKGTGKESESVTDTPPYFEQGSQTNPMSVRGEQAATRFIVYNFTLPSP